MVTDSWTVRLERATAHVSTVLVLLLISQKKGQTAFYSLQKVTSGKFTDIILLRPDNFRRCLFIIGPGQTAYCEVRRLTQLSSADCIWIGWAILHGYGVGATERLKIDFGSNVDLHKSRTKCINKVNHANVCVSKKTVFYQLSLA